MPLALAGRLWCQSGQGHCQGDIQDSSRDAVHWMAPDARSRTAPGAIPCGRAATRLQLLTTSASNLAHDGDDSVVELYSPGLSRGGAWARSEHATPQVPTEDKEREFRHPLATECEGAPAPAFPAGRIVFVCCRCPATEMETAVAPGTGRELSSETAAGRGPRGNDADVSCRGFRWLAGPLLTAGRRWCRTRACRLAARPRCWPAPRTTVAAAAALSRLPGCRLPWSISRALDFPSQVSPRSSPGRERAEPSLAAASVSMRAPWRSKLRVWHSAGSTMRHERPAPCRPVSTDSPDLRWPARPVAAAGRKPSAGTSPAEAGGRTDGLTRMAGRESAGSRRGFSGHLAEIRGCGHGASENLRAHWYSVLRRTWMERMAASRVDGSETGGERASSATAATRLQASIDAALRLAKGPICGSTARCGGRTRRTEAQAPASGPERLARRFRGCLEEGGTPGRPATRFVPSVAPWLAIAVLAFFAHQGPAAQLSPEIQADRFLMQAEDRIQKQDFAGAKAALDRILELEAEHGLTIPEAFHFRHAEVTLRVGQHEEAIESVTRYLTVAGRDGEHYREALRLLNAAEAVQNSPVAGMEFVRVPAGEFLMGSTSEEASSLEQPLARVRISGAFELGKHEVTQAEWEAVMGSNPSSFDECGGDCPVEKVSWGDVQEFIGRLNTLEGEARYRLPTEAEWEYAARAGTVGDRYGNVDAIAWYEGNSGGRTHPVGQKAPNAWGLHDMLGNVWEWVQDWYGGYPGGSETDPQGPASGSFRVCRGGGWLDGAGSCRVSHRSYYPSGVRSVSLGFRLLRME